ncbi:trans-sulfuration enzyme family protein [Microbacterium halophytorum]|uniref:trans-sulfuration enzyme family protein n=1 Tax=Microbacterium halophytorum TaxID=2067568 RepID=UPI000CFAA38A|nr:aminotransferase class I/II-fold pyridoxal phosphate-dependent enzyme [Microbacterium halophytorum]
MAADNNLRTDSLVVAAGRPPRRPGAPVNPPVVMSSTYVGADWPSGDELVYARYDTESWRPLEEAIGALEGSAERALAFGSGMAAISAALSLVPNGGTLVMPRHSYNTSLVAAKEHARLRGIALVEVDIADTAAVTEALDGADDLVLWVESPTNPMLEVADIAALAAAAHEREGIVIADNTFATPLAQRPLALGADVVVHSVTKYLAGHSDVVMGAVVADDGELWAALKAQRDVHGAIPGPWEAWLALRGIRTLALRIERSQRSALDLATRLEAHPAVAEVRHPGLASHPQHELAAAQMTGFGSVLTLRPRGGAAAASEIARAVRLWVPGTSLGGVESLIERRRRIPSEPVTVPEDLLRLSVGVEHVEDLADDLFAALEASQR